MNGENIISKQDLSQIKKDIERISLHPILKSEEVRTQIQWALQTFVAMNNSHLLQENIDQKERKKLIVNKGVSYIQGIDTIASSLFVMGFESQSPKFIELLPTILKHTYDEFSKHFLDPETGHLDFRYSSLVMTRLLNYFEPDLAVDMKDIDHSLYLIKWFMTLFGQAL